MLKYAQTNESTRCGGSGNMSQFLIECRKSMGLKANQMAERLEIDPSYISKLESGEVPMTYAVAAAYSRVTRKARIHFESMIPPRNSKRNGRLAAAK